MCNMKIMIRNQNYYFFEIFLLFYFCFFVIIFFFQSKIIYFLLKEQPSVSLALPPVGVQRTLEQEPQVTTVWAWEKTVVIARHPGHLTSMKKDRGAGTRVLSLCFLASDWGVGLRRSWAKTYMYRKTLELELYALRRIHLSNGEVIKDIIWLLFDSILEV